MLFGDPEVSTQWIAAAIIYIGIPICTPNANWVSQTEIYRCCNGQFGSRVGSSFRTDVSAACRITMGTSRVAQVERELLLELAEGKKTFEQVGADARKACRVARAGAEAKFITNGSAARFAC